MFFYSFSSKVILIKQILYFLLSDIMEYLLNQTFSFCSVQSGV